MIALAWLVIIAVASLLIVRLGTTALMLTGLGQDTSEFQAYSAFFGVGFTTRESEAVVNHPVRRRIVRHLILAGQVGLTSVIVPLVVTFVNIHSVTEGAKQFGLIVGALLVLWALSTTRPIKAMIDASVKFALRRAKPFRRVLDHEVLLRLHAGYAVSEVALGDEHALVGRALGDSDSRGARHRRPRHHARRRRLRGRATRAHRVQAERRLDRVRPRHRGRAPDPQRAAV